MTKQFLLKIDRVIPGTLEVLDRGSLHAMLKDSYKYFELGLVVGAASSNCLLLLDSMLVLSPLMLLLRTTRSSFRKFLWCLHWYLRLRFLLQFFWRHYLILN